MFSRLFKSQVMSAARTFVRREAMPLIEGLEGRTMMSVSGVAIPPSGFDNLEQLAGETVNATVSKPASTK